MRSDDRYQGASPEVTDSADINAAQVDKRGGDDDNTPWRYTRKPGQCKTKSGILSYTQPPLHESSATGWPSSGCVSHLSVLIHLVPRKPAHLQRALHLHPQLSFLRIQKRRRHPSIITMKRVHRRLVRKALLVPQHRRHQAL
jgi:hypothetical protein